MNKLIKYFNKKYGKEYGKISYPRTTIQIYQVYQIIKDCNIEDNELTDLLHHVKLPKPKTMEEMEMYSECINDGIPQNKMMPQILNEYTIELTADELNNLEYHESMAGNHRVLDFSKYNIDFQKLNKFVIYMGIDFDSLCRVQDSTSYDSIYYDSNYIEYYTNTLNNEMKIYSSEKFTQGRIIKIFEITGYINDMYITPKDNIAIGGFARKNNIAVGEGAIAPNSNSIAIGTEVFAKGNSSCAQGSYVTANGDSSCAQGRGTIARGDYSHAEGLGTETNTVADAAHAEGFQTKASSDYQHVQGKYNIEDTANKYAHIVGNGTDNSTRSNAHTLDWNGNGWYAGKLSQEGTPTDSKDLITKKYFDSNIPKSSDLTDYAKKNEIPKSASDVGADATGTATTKVTEHNTSNVSHNDIRLLITNLTNKLNALADSDDTTLDQLSEIVTYIKNNKSLIDGITTSKLNISDVADNLTTNITNKALSAKQGVELKKLIDAITVPTKVSQLTNDSKFLTSIPAEYITEDELNTKGYLTKHQDISGKVDKVEGKGLSTVDFTTAYETKLKGLSNYNDTIIKNNIDAINAKINTMFSFNDNGELVVTIGEVSKTFVPKSE